MSRDRIEFRLAPGPSDDADVVEVYVNGRPLIDLWRRSSGEGGRWMRGIDVFWPGKWLWSDDPPPSATDDRRVVLTCVDGSTDCGGATARIVHEDRLVTWSDFETVPDRVSVTLGPFVFVRKQYRQALEKAAQRVR